MSIPSVWHARVYAKTNAKRRDASQRQSICGNAKEAAAVDVCVCVRERLPGGVIGACLNGRRNRVGEPDVYPLLTLQRCLCVRAWLFASSF